MTTTTTKPSGKTPTPNLVQGQRVPPFMYGTAWKEDRTQALVRMAFSAGFRAIDTANQRKHYNEAGVGAALADSGLARDEVFLQTKFTYQRGQDHRLPYDPAAPIASQVAQSFQSSLEHLGVSYLDAYVLHGPWGGGWSVQDREAWGAMEALHGAGGSKLLGVSNVSLDQLEALCASATVPPAFVQNRCYARSGWDRGVRALCRERGMVYQGFSLLTANQRELGGAAAAGLARRLGITIAQLTFAFARAVGMLPLTGTTSAAHMTEDLGALAVELSAEDVAAVEGLG